MTEEMQLSEYQLMKCQGNILVLYHLGSIIETNAVIKFLAERGLSFRSNTQMHNCDNKENFLLY